MSQPKKIAVELTVEIDLEAWALDYGLVTDEGLADEAAASRDLKQQVPAAVQHYLSAQLGYAATVS